MYSLCRSLNVFPVSASVFFVSASVLSQSLSFYVIHHLPVSVIIFLCQPASFCATHRLSHVSLSLSLPRVPVSVSSRVSVFPCVLKSSSLVSVNHISVFLCYSLYRLPVSVSMSCYPGLPVSVLVCLPV